MKINEWLLMALNLYSYFLIGNKNKFGFILGLTGCIIGMFLFYESFPIFFMYLCFMILNVKSYIKWSKNEN